MIIGMTEEIEDILRAIEQDETLLIAHIYSAVNAFETIEFQILDQY